MWGFSEALFFFIVPDVGVGLVAMLSFRDGLKAAVAAILGAILGGTLLFAVIHLGLGSGVERFLLIIPGITPSMLNVARSQIAQAGVGALVVAPLQGIPYKIYVTELTLTGSNLSALLLWTIPSRALRLLPVAVIAGGFGRLFRGSIQRRFTLWVAMYLLAWAGFYGWYYMHIR